MHLALYLASTTLLAVLSPTLNAADANAGGGSCKLGTPFEAFSASLYTAIYVSTDPQIANGLQISGGDAAMTLYTILNNVLDEYGVCNSELFAFTAARSLASVGTLTFKNFWIKTAQTFGTVLYRHGLLDCNNAELISLNLFTYIKKVLKVLDNSKFESQFQGSVRGGVQFYKDLGFNLEDIAQEMGVEFAAAFSDSDKCKAKTSSTTRDW